MAAIVINNNVSLSGNQYYLVPLINGVPCYHHQPYFDCVPYLFSSDHPNRTCSCFKCSWEHQELSKKLALGSRIERPKSIRWCSWKKPELGWTKLNTDGSVSTKKEKAGIGGIFRDHKGDPLCGYVFKVARDDIFLVELWAIWRGLVHALTIGVRKIWVESDALHAVNTINGKQSAHGQKASIALNYIQELLGRFEKYSVTHSWREANGAADWLAKMEISGSDIILWPKDFPRSLNKIIKDDANGKRYERKG